MEPKFDPHDPEYAPDFSLSENVAPAYFEILQEHEYVMKQYQDVLKFRIFRCEKGN